MNYSNQNNMYDTIHFKLHDIILHKHLENILKVPDGVTRKSKRVAIPVSKFIVDGEEFITYPISYLQFNDTLKTIDNEYKHKIKLGSYHYTMAYRISHDEDFIEFNLSIPKYLYGTNVIQYVENSNSHRFMYGIHKEIKYNQEESYKKLLLWIKYFFDREFPSCQVFLENLQISRLDICFNQIFTNKTDALKYLEFQKKIRKPYQREAAQNYEGTSINIVHKDYSFKIYHKGTEFESHDARELRKNMSQTKTSPTRIKLLQTLADKTLRYELTIRPAYMAQIWLNQIKKTAYGKQRHSYFTKLQNNVDQWNLKINNDGKKVKAVRKSIQRAKAVRRINLASLDKLYLIENYEIQSNQTAKKLDKFQLHELNSYNKIMARSYKFFPFEYHDNRKEFVKSLSDVNNLSTNAELKYQNYSSLLNDAIINRFWELFNQFQVEKLSDFDSVTQKFITYNNSLKEINKNITMWPELKRKEKRENDVKKFLMLFLQNNMDFRALEKNGVYSRSQLWRYKTLLKKIGIENINQDLTYFNPSKDFQPYHDFTMFNRQIF